jgi:hypothetical protein
MKFITMATLFALLVIGAYSNACATEKDNYFELSAGFKSSGDQKDVLSEIYSDAEISGGSAMLSIELGYMVNISDHFSIIPSINWSVMTIKTDTLLDNVQNESYNSYFLTGVSFQYDFSGVDDGFYAGIKGASSSISMSDKLSRINSVESDGIATGYYIGYAKSNKRYEFGSENIPVLVDADNTPQMKADFGGVYLMFRIDF